MRNFFASTLYQEIKKNKKIILLSADIGNRLFDKIKKDFPKNFLNCGIAEPNMVTFAAGLSKNGFLPVCYTITNFLIYKSLEQIRNDAIYNNNKILLVGTGSGMSYSHLGPTHHSLEDIGFLNNLPKIKIFSPADNNDVKVHLEYCLKNENKNTAYIRLGKKNEPIISKYKSKIDNLNYVIKNKSNIAIIFTGPLSEHLFEAQKKLEKINIKFDIINFHQIKPISKNMIRVLKNYRTIYTLEEHFPNTGIYSILSTKLCNEKVKVISVNNKEDFISELGTRKFVQNKFGIDSKSLFKKILNDKKKNWN